MTIRRFWQRSSVSGRIALLVLLAFVLLAIFAPVVARLPHDVSSGPPLSPPSADHILGTDDLGYDLWSMISHGARTSLAVGVLTALFAGVLGAFAGIAAAYREGWTDRVVMRVVDVMVILPDLPAMILLAALFGPSVRTIIIVLVLFSWSIPARMLRSQALVLKEQPYIRMAGHYGAGTFYLMRHHFLPELLPLLSVSMIRLAGMAIVAEASLSFLGLGDPTSKSWGLIINHAISFPGILYTPFWKWWLVFPWLFLALLVTSLALIGRELERFADPRIR